MKINKVAKNASWIVGCKIMQSGLALLINAVTARYFGPSNYGLLNYAASLVAFVTPIATMGTSEVLVGKLINTPEREGELLGTSIALNLVSSLCCIIGISSFLWLSNPDDTVANVVVGLYSLILIAQSLEQIQYWFHAKYISKYVSIISLAAYLVISIYKFILLYYKKSIYWFAISNSADYLLIAISLMIIYRVKNGTKLIVTRSAAKELLGLGKHYILPGLMGLVLAQSDRVMLRWMYSDTEVGFYSAALSITALTGFVFNAIITSFRSFVLEEKTISKSRFEKAMTQCYGVITYLAIIQSVFLVIFAKPVVNILYGVQYDRSIGILKVLVWYTTFSYIGGVRTIWILAEGKQKYLWIISFFGMTINIVLNFLLIPRLQEVGAAIATVITQLFTNVVLIYWIKPLRDNLRYMVKGFIIRDLVRR